VSATALALGLATAAALCAQTPPDFSGVYYPINPFGRFVGGLLPGPVSGKDHHRSQPHRRRSRTGPQAGGRMNRRSRQNTWRNGKWSARLSSPVRRNTT
jgi:hypothetical protein